MQPYLPDDLPLQHLDHRRLIGLVGKANAELARYDGLLRGIVNPGIMLSPLTTQEAVLSSKIEGTQATLDEVFEHESGDLKEGEKAQDIQEIVNYRTALSSAREFLIDRPITLGLVRELHRVLMSSVRGQNKTPGDFRRDQNWIGRPGCSIDEATFVPPNPLVMEDYLGRWEAYLRQDDIDVVIQTAVAHAQFELLHPFKDGNGRMGRLLIPLLLYQKQALFSPSFYLSQYLEDRRDTYYERLQAISNAGDWDGWVEFFLGAVVQQSEQNCLQVRSILGLYDEMKVSLPELTRSQYALAALDALFYRPIFQTSDFVARSRIPKQTALPMLKTMRQAGILREVRVASGRRPGILSFPRLLGVIESRPESGALLRSVQK